MWQKIKKKFPNIFFYMKELHGHITGDIVKNHQNTTLEKLWKHYLVKGLDFR